MFIFAVLVNVVAFFAFVSLVVTTFTSGGSVASFIHSSISTLGGVAAKLQSEASSGNTDAPAQIRIWLETKLQEAIIGAMGLSKAVLDRLMTVAKELEEDAS